MTSTPTPAQVPIAFVDPAQAVAFEGMPQKTFFDHAWAPYAEREAAALLEGVGCAAATRRVAPPRVLERLTCTRRDPRA